MKALLLAVLAAVLCVERAHTLICFSCSDASSNWACLKPVKCGENENHCVTTYVGVGLGEGGLWMPESFDKLPSQPSADGFLFAAPWFGLCLSGSAHLAPKVPPLNSQRSLSRLRSPRVKLE
ncbi:hypothetical protein BTVI_31811 [Pitangus sulphuratus]|nr:hypothetical protein BTVI_31811 [Pitangus sulphuratus]